MSRLVRFRAWDKARQVMIGNDYPDNWDDEVESTEEFYGDENHLRLSLIEGTYRDSNLIVERRTGLKDINDKWIYEGDILQDDGGNSATTEVVWDEAGGLWGARWKYQGIDEYGIAFDGAETELLYNHLTSCNCVIIGNIHEIPELLEEDN